MNEEYTPIDPTTIEDQHLGYGTFDCPNCGPSVFFKEVVGVVYTEVCTQDCEYGLYAPLYTAPDGSTVANFDKASERGLNDEAEARLP